MEQPPELFNEFAQHYKDQPRLVEYVRHLLTSRPAYRRPIDLVPMLEYQRRLEAIQVIQKEQRRIRSAPSWRFSALQFSVLILMPLEDLEGFRARDSPTGCLDQLNGLFNFFLQTPTKLVDPEEGAHREAARKAHRAAAQKERRAASKTSASRPSASDLGGSKHSVPRPNPESEMTSKAASEASVKERIITRSNDARIDALRFDSRRCLVTGTKHPDGCHIMPFTTNDRPSYLEKVQSFQTTIAICFGLGPEQETGEKRRPLFAGLGSSDKVFNILSLTPSLHRFWSKCYCAFKWHGISKVDGEETHVLLQFHWMPRSSHKNGGRYIDLDDQTDPECNRSIMGGLSHHYGPDGNPHCSALECTNCKETDGCSIVNVNNGHPLVSGHLFTVKRPTATLGSFEQMIKLQWAIVRAAAMSGAALAPELLVGPDDDDDDDGFPVDLLLQWRQEAQMSDPEAPPEEPSEVAEEQAMAHGRHGS